MTPSDLAHRYAAYVDARDGTALVGLFTADGVLVTPSPPDHLDPIVEHRGATGIRSALAPLAAFARTRHQISRVVVDGSVGRVTGEAHHYLEDGTDFCWQVQYDDEYRETDEGWRIARRSVTALAIERIGP